MKYVGCCGPQNVLSMLLVAVTVASGSAVSLTLGRAAVGQSIAPAPATAGAPATQPVDTSLGYTAGRQNLVERVRHGLQVGHNSLGSVSEQLLGVQNQVALFEKRLIGRVMDSQDAQTLYAQHQLVMAGNQEATREISNLHAQTVALSQQLAALQKQLADQTKDYQKAEEKLAQRVIEDNNEIRTLSDQLSALKVSVQEVSPAVRSLSVDHQKLEEQSRLSAPQRQEVDHLKQAVSEANSQNTQEVTTQGTETAELLQVHRFNKQCHERVQALQHDLKIVSSVQPIENKTLAAVVKQGVAAAHAAEQRLVSENAMIRSLIQEEDLENEKALVQLRKSRQEQQRIKAEIAQEVSSLEVKISSTIEQVSTVNGSIKANINTMQEDMKKKAYAEKELGKLRLKYSPVEMEAARTENSALAVQSAQLRQLVNDGISKAAYHQAMLTKAEAAASANTLANANAKNALRRAEDDSAAEVAEALDEAKKAQAESEAELARTKDALQVRCGDQWAAYGAEKQQELDQCDSNRKELVSVKAMKETLKTSLEAMSA